MRRLRSFMLGPAQNLHGWEIARVAIPLWILAIVDLVAHL